MNYEKIYNQIVERAKNRILEGYKERHHIIPRCMGGTNDSTNIVELTPKEHFICHMLLARAYPNNNKLWYAVHAMSVKLGSRKEARDFKVSSRQYHEIKSNLKMSDETKQKLREANLGKKYVRTEEYRKKVSDAAKGKKKIMTPARLAYYENMKGRPGRPAWNKGIKPSAETINKIKESLSKKPNPMKDPEIVKKVIETRRRNKEEKIKNGTYVPKIPWNKGKSNK